ncbi:MAG: sigma-70 family RNA polymerase sigma factor [Ruminococcus sp.]|nr:sigma-70 family RNA polymerase sigma factor [Ruminococcus sp.]
MSRKQNAYSTQSDSVLAELTREGDQKAFDELVRRYLGKIGFIARRYSAQGYEQNDFIQEGLLGLLSACKSYDDSCSSSFKTYMSVVVERRFISIIRRMNTKKTVPDSALVQIDGLSEELEDNAQSPEQLIMDREQLGSMQSKLRALLSDREYQTLMLYASGLSYSAISQKLGITEKSVDNALQRVRRKAGGLY